VFAAPSRALEYLMAYMPFDKSPESVTTTSDPSAVIATSCPFCRSSQVTTTSKTVSSSTYWRCQTCGEIWNPSREAAVPTFRRARW
jgi:transposase-like protein